MGGCKTYGGRKRTRERVFPKIFGPLQKSFWSALSWILVQEKQSTDTWRGVENVPYEGGPNPFFWRGVIREVFHPPLFSTPLWRPLIHIIVVTGKWLDSPVKGNVDKMSEKCRKNVREISKNCPEALRTQFSDIFWTFFAYLVGALFGDAVQCSPVTTL